DGRHFGLVVDDKDAVRRALAAAGIKPLPGPFLDFRDPWGNRIEIVGYDNIQFTKAPNVLRGMGLTHLSKNKSAIKELKDKGMAPSCRRAAGRGRVTMPSIPPLPRRVPRCRRRPPRARRRAAPPRSRCV